MNKVLGNFLNLTLLQFSTMVVQILIYPYLNNVLGGRVYGEIIFQQIIILHLQMIVFFGTDISAVRLAAKYISNKKKLIIVVSKITLGRLYIALLIVFLYVVYIFISGIDPWFCIYALSIFEAAFTLRWFFHGVQQLNKFAFPYCIIRFIGTLFIFLFVTGAGDWYKVVVITVGSSLLSVLVSWALYYRNFGFYYVKFKSVYLIFYDSFSLFITNLVSVVKDRSGGIFIGYFLGPSSLVYYDFCIKIVGVISSVTSSISAALFPSFSENYNSIYFRKYNKLIFTFSVLPFLISLVASDYVIITIYQLFKIDLSPVRLLFPVFGIMIFVRSHGYFLGLCYLMARNYKKRYASSLIISGCFYMLYMGGASFLGFNSLISLGIGIASSLVIEYFHRIYLCLKTRTEICGN
ncbi:oligosaccharide flippase family protein [Citrobacter portucalensis]|uniref:Putative O-antigen transporter n=1 Tax=Citrobacter portucalensis TaxID=1639133 RepID=A0AAW5WEB6_9ENTR|nr:oligosaccharide flippase family protein [Citrobacter portucalensis]MCX9004902.1 oligosaccharide flippase family protein [Citrobacter portucalensis]